MTTIQIQEETLVLLKKYKKQSKAKDYDEIISNFVQMGLEARRLRGCLKPYLKKDITKAELYEGLRDKKDRY